MVSGKAKNHEDLAARWAEWAGAGRSAFEEELKRCPDGTRLLEPSDTDYPSRLSVLRTPPAFIYLRGDPSILRLPTVAMVGSRRIDPEGVRVTRQLAGEIAASGVCLVSGGALGVDTIVHRAALDAGHPTIVVLPGGLNRPTPRSNRRLFEEVVERGGLLITELSLNTSARKYHFHRRNTLIAALGDAVVVARARVDGGTHITARAAVELGRELYCIPGSPEDPFSAGCLDWLQRGATIAWRGRHVVGASMAGTAAPDEASTARQTDLLACLDQGLDHVEAIVDALPVPVAEIQREILMHELAGEIVRDPATGRLKRSTSE